MDLPARPIQFPHVISLSNVLRDPWQHLEGSWYTSELLLTCRWLAGILSLPWWAKLDAPISKSGPWTLSQPYPCRRQHTITEWLFDKIPSSIFCSLPHSHPSLSKYYDHGYFAIYILSIFYSTEFGREHGVLAYATVFWPAFDKSHWCRMCGFKFRLDRQLSRHRSLVDTNYQDQAELKIWAVISSSSMFSNIHLNNKLKYLWNSNLDS